MEYRICDHLIVRKKKKRLAVRDRYLLFLYLLKFNFCYELSEPIIISCNNT